MRPGWPTTRDDNNNNTSLGAAAAAGGGPAGSSSSSGVAPWSPPNDGTDARQPRMEAQKPRKRPSAVAMVGAGGAVVSGSEPPPPKRGRGRPRKVPDLGPVSGLDPQTADVPVVPLSTATDKDIGLNVSTEATGLIFSDTAMRIPLGEEEEEGLLQLSPSAEGPSSGQKRHRPGRPPWPISAAAAAAATSAVSTLPARRTSTAATPPSPGRRHPPVGAQPPPSLPDSGGRRSTMESRSQLSSLPYWPHLGNPCGAWAAVMGSRPPEAVRKLQPIVAAAVQQSCGEGLLSSDTASRAVAVAMPGGASWSAMIGSHPEAARKVPGGASWPELPLPALPLAANDAARAEGWDQMDFEDWLLCLVQVGVPAGL